MLEYYSKELKGLNQKFLITTQDFKQNPNLSFTYPRKRARKRKRDKRLMVGDSSQ